jgi:hypothetical protein
MLRATVARNTLCTHSDSEAHTLERQAAYGGRASTFCFNPIGVRGRSPDRIRNLADAQLRDRRPVALYQIDVRSLYPTLLRDCEFPVKLLSSPRACEPAEVVDAAKHLGVIASVVIRSPSPYYPRRTAKGIDYPTGQFSTVLTGPELLKLSTEGEILKCHTMTLYKMGRAFASFAETMLRLRSEAAFARDASDERVIKLLSNSLAGKLAQKAGRWVRDSKRDENGRWGELTTVHAQTGRVTRRRWILGQCYRWDAEKHPAGPHTSAFAYLTAYGRLYLRSIIEKCPPRTVVSVDTDGLWILPDAAEALGSYPDLFGDSPGRLRVTATAHDGQFFGPKHYRVDNQWVLSGFSQTPADPFDSEVWEEQHVNPVVPAPNGPPVRTVTRSQRKSLPIDSGNAVVGADGWVVPRHIPHRSIGL